jgi:hypothetical protein
MLWEEQIALPCIGAAGCLANWCTYLALGAGVTATRRTAATICWRSTRRWSRCSRSGAGRSVAGAMSGLGGIPGLRQGRTDGQQILSRQYCTVPPVPSPSPTDLLSSQCRETRQAMSRFSPQRAPSPAYPGPAPMPGVSGGRGRAPGSQAWDPRRVRRGPGCRRGWRRRRGAPRVRP